MRKYIKFFYFFIACLAFLVNPLLADMKPYAAPFMLGITAIAGTEGDSAIGGKNLSLGPCNVYFGNIAGTALTGTIDTTSGSANVTGTTTLFTSELKVGDWIKIVGITPLVQIKTITTDTALVLFTNAPATVTGALGTLTDVIFLGGSDKTTLKFAVKKAELKESQSGDVRADKAVTGYECSIELGLSRATLSRMERTVQGLLLVRDSVTSVIKGAGFTVRLGEVDSSIVKELRLVRIVGGVDSTDPLDTVVIPKAAPTAEGEAAYDAASQRFLKTMFEGYIDQSTTIGGVPVVWYLGDITP